MHVLKRRRISILLTIVMVAITSGVAVFAASLGDSERVSAMWISARVQPDGLAVTEVIDYDFGVAQRHGIFRDIPDLAPGSDVEVFSATAPDMFEVIPQIGQTRIKIGDPDQTISGRHRYRIDFTLDRSAVLTGDNFAWNAIGNEWTVDMSNVDIRVDLGATARSLQCVQGTAWSDQSCDIGTASDSTTLVHLSQLTAGDGVTVYGIAGGSTGDDALPPSGPVEDPGIGLAKAVWLATIAALIGAVAATVAVRRAGREKVWAGGATVAAFGPDDPNAPVERIDERRLGELATTEFESPRGMSAVEGAVLLDEAVKDHHLAAWLLESAVRGELEIEGEMGDPTLVRTNATAHPTAEPVLRRMFHGRDRIDLGSYDSYFASGWQLLKSDVTRWRRGASYWDRSGHKRQNTVRVLGSIVALLGLAITAVGASFANRNGGNWVVVLVLGGVIAGGATATLVHSWELLIRSPDGTARWLQVESFRRFLHESEASHVTQAAELGLLREYTAWAVALDEADRWTLAVAAANRADPALKSRLGNDLVFIALGSSLSHSVRSAHTQPSSSGGGGGFSAGGGGGGGGGGSW